MSLRPRYSLLTLLILTALVAGGVKLWHGPHHAVEQLDDYEMEYTYTRDWRGDKIVHGPYVLRFFRRSKQGELHAVQIFYFRDGLRLPWLYMVYYPSELIAAERSMPTEPFEADPLTSPEREAFQQVIRQERLKFKPKRGISPAEIHGPA